MSLALSIMFTLINWAATAAIWWAVHENRKTHAAITKQVESNRESNAALCQLASIIIEQDKTR